MCILAVPHLFRGRLIVVHDFAHRDNVRPSVLPSLRPNSMLALTYSRRHKKSTHFRSICGTARPVLFSFPSRLVCDLFRTVVPRLFLRVVFSDFSRAAWWIFNMCRLVFWRWKGHGYPLKGCSTERKHVLYYDCNFSICKNVQFYGKMMISYLGQLQ